MKRIIIALLIMACAAGMFAGQGDMQLGPSFGLILPIGDYGDLFNASPKFGAKYIYGIKDNMAIEGNLAYAYLLAKDYLGSDDVSRYLVELSAGFRYDLNEKFYTGGGLAFNSFGVSYEGLTYNWVTGMYESEDVSSTYSEIGIFGFGGYIKKFSSFDLDLQLRLQLIDGSIITNFDACLNFPIGK